MPVIGFRLCRKDARGGPSRGSADQLLHGNDTAGEASHVGWVRDAIGGKLPCPFCAHCATASSAAAQPQAQGGRSGQFVRSWRRNTVHTIRRSANGVAYDPWKAYCQAMLATLLFAQELQRRSDLLNWGLTAVAAHPGNLRPRMTANGDSPTGPARRLRGSIAAPMDASPSHSAEEGALPALFAATAPDIRHGGSYGPGGPSETTGPAEQAGLGQNASGEEGALRLWEMTEQLIGIKWPAE